MQLIQKNFKQGTVRLKIESLDDIWTLKNVIEVDDILFGTTERKIKIGDSATDRNVKVVKKHVFMKIKAEKIEYEPEHHTLRVTGTIEEGPEDVPKGSYHSFTLAVGTDVSIQKTQWHSYLIEKLEQSTKKYDTYLIALFDREQALIGQFSKQGFSQLTQLQGSVTKKTDQQIQSSDFFEELATLIDQYNTRLDPQKIILSSAQFWKQYTVEKLQKKGDALQKKIVFIESTSVTTQAVQELLARKEFLALNKEDMISQQSHTLKEILRRIAKDEPATYGYSHAFAAAEQGAVEQTLIAHKYIEEQKEKGTFKEIEQYISLVEQTRGSVSIVDEESPIHAELVGLGGVACLLRFSVE